MTPEAADLLRGARGDLDDARKILAIGLTKIAARSAYYAVFHAAEAYIVEQTGRIAKTHSGVRSEFSRLLSGTPDTERDMGSFLGRAYRYKQLSDYAVGARAEIATEDAADVIVEAASFVERVAALLEGPSPPSSSPP